MQYHAKWAGRLPLVTAAPLLGPALLRRGSMYGVGVSLLLVLDLLGQVRAVQRAGFETLLDPLFCSMAGEWLRQEPG